MLYRLFLEILHDMHGGILLGHNDLCDEYSSVVI